MVHFNIKKMENPELVNLKCVTYAQPIPLPLAAWKYKLHLPLLHVISTKCYFQIYSNYHNNFLLKKINKVYYISTTHTLFQVTQLKGELQP